jgi:hypothetical protein
MTADDDPRSFIDEFADRRAEPLQPSGIGNLAIFERDVEIGAKQHPFASCLELVERMKGH